MADRLTPGPGRPAPASGGAKPVYTGKPHAYVRRGEGQALEPAYIRRLATNKDGSKAYVVTRYASDGREHSGGWISTGVVNDAPSPTDFLGGPMAFAKTVPQAAGRVFWSGGVETAMKPAAKWALENGGRTLEQTVGGAALNATQKGAEWLLMNERKASRAMAPLWNAASRSFAKGAKGDVNVFLGPKVRPGSVWKTVEEPILQTKNRIISHFVE